MVAAPEYNIPGLLCGDWCWKNLDGTFAGRLSLRGALLADRARQSRVMTEDVVIQCPPLVPSITITDGLTRLRIDERVYVLERQAFEVACTALFPRDRAYDIKNSAYWTLSSIITALDLLEGTNGRRTFCVEDSAVHRVTMMLTYLYSHYQDCMDGCEICRLWQQVARVHAAECAVSRCSVPMCSLMKARLLICSCLPGSCTGACGMDGAAPLYRPVSFRDGPRLLKEIGFTDTTFAVKTVHRVLDEDRKLKFFEMYNRTPLSTAAVSESAGQESDAVSPFMYCFEGAVSKSSPWPLQPYPVAAPVITKVSFGYQLGRGGPRHLESANAQAYIDAFVYGDDVTFVADDSVASARLRDMQGVMAVDAPSCIHLRTSAQVCRILLVTWVVD